MVIVKEKVRNTAKRRNKGRKFLRQWSGVEVILVLHPEDKGARSSHTGRIERHEKMWISYQKTRDVTSGYFFIGEGNEFQREVYLVPTKGITGLPEGPADRFRCNVLNLKQNFGRNYEKIPAEIRKR